MNKTRIAARMLLALALVAVACAVHDWKEAKFCGETLCLRPDLWRKPEDVEWATLNWVDWCNHRRLLEPIGNILPAEAEAAYYRQQATLPKAA